MDKITEQMNKVKIINRQMVDLKEQLDDAVYHRGTNKHASLNLKECKECSIIFNMDFYEYVARCINHEFLHYLLDIEHGETVCRNLDNIAKKNIDYWMW